MTAPNLPLAAMWILLSLPILDGLWLMRSLEASNIRVTCFCNYAHAG